MQSQNPSHYREHTRQQDGWTFLAPEPELPPPYTPDAPPVTPASAVPAGITLTFQIPTNSNTIGAPPITQTKKYGRNVPFAITFMEICNVMGVDPASACLSYKWDKEGHNVPTRQLANTFDWEDCLTAGIGMTQRARTRQVTCIIKNLNLPIETASAVNSTGTKRKSAASDNSAGRRTFDFTKEYRALKAHLHCAKHKDQYCYVSPVDGHHHRVEPDNVLLWAKEISVGHATVECPPENIVFQELFLPARKKAHTTNAETLTSRNRYIPTIHVTVNTGSSGGNVSPLRRSPLATIMSASANRNNIDVPTSLYRSQSLSLGGDENSLTDPIRFPPVTDILQLIDNSGMFEDSTVLTFPAIIFADALHDWQITHVDQVPLLDADFYVQQTDMPRQLAELFIEESIAAIGRAQKGKSSA
ncbi:hypothetical protein DFH07DRAFT_954911 [Mycena maculata]|uniref:Uncharacterized protein n=1 Tax=Mycena maculata TaxID=230809 RepID=A0AAD7JM06_9AGAR|nr:hypothetical protein DFH07DRAFT_954911 [Mycena maculata]